jgi:uncharacterized caspase-like protein
MTLMRRWHVAMMAILVGLALVPKGSRADDSGTATGRRIALVIGNSAYQHAGALTNPRNDAEAMTKLFKDAGFATVESKSDLSVAEFRHALADFEVLAGDADIAVIYYSGHGIEFGGRNYLA